MAEEKKTEKKKRVKKSYKANKDKRILYIYDYLTQTSRDKDDIAAYVAGGYVIKHIEKPSISVDEMRDKLKGSEFEAKFEENYSKKNGFHDACKVYQDFLKAKKKAEKEAKGKKEENK